jgi:type IV secretion system protein VirB8
MFKRSQRDVSDGSKHWYQDKYQHVLTQRNMLALIAVVALIAAAMSVLAVMRLVPLKTVEPYLVQVEEKTGVTQRVIPLSRKDYAANQGIDRYFTATYIRMRESYNINILRYNYNIVRLMSMASVFNRFRREVDPKKEDSIAARLGTFGQRDVRIRSMVYITNPSEKNKSGKAKGESSQSKIIQANVTTIESSPNSPDKESRWVITVTFEYADLGLNQEEQILNPLGYTVSSYQIQPEIE